MLNLGTWNQSYSTAHARDFMLLVSPFSSLPVVGCCYTAGLEQTRLHLTFTDGQGPLIEGLLARLGELSWGMARTDRGCSVGLWGAFSVFPFGIPAPQSWPQTGWFCVWEQPEHQLPRTCLSELGSIAVGPLRGGRDEQRLTDCLSPPAGRHLPNTGNQLEET